MATEGKFTLVKWLFTLLVLGGIIAAMVWYYRHRSEEAPEYQTAQVTRGDLTQVVTATGQLNPVVNVQVGSQISGRIQKIYVDYNSQVKSNQLIAEIDPSTYKVNVLRAEAQLANAQANLVLAEVQARRADSLFTNSLIPAAEHEIADAQLEKSKAEVLSAEASVESARVDLSRCTIYAPVDGVVISRNVDVGQTVAASFNTPTLFLIANDLTKMQIDALVSEADIGGVVVGQDVKFSVDAYPYREFRGKLGQIRYGAITNQNVVSYDCVVEVNNDEQKLLPGMTANVSIITAERNNVLCVPNAALRFRPPDATGGSGPAFSGGGGGGPGTRPAGAGAGPAGRTMAASSGRGVERPAGEGGGPRGAVGGPGGMGRPGGGRGPERQQVRTVYVVPEGASGRSEKAALKPVQIKVGITDGVNTEVLEGLEENARIVTGVLTTTTGSSSTPGRPAGNPFGGGGFRRF